jgi:hypothetical protein
MPEVQPRRTACQNLDETAARRVNHLMDVGESLGQGKEDPFTNR